MGDGHIRPNDESFLRSQVLSPRGMDIKHHDHRRRADEVEFNIKTNLDDHNRWGFWFCRRAIIVRLGELQITILNDFMPVAALVRTEFGGDFNAIISDEFKVAQSQLPE